MWSMQESTGIIFIETCKSHPGSVVLGAAFTIIFYLTIKGFTKCKI